jgi:hypothetical protein
MVLFHIISHHIIISGTATYVNGDTLEGSFVQGRAHGMIKYTFATTGAVNHAHYCRGLRVSFESKASAKVMSTQALQFLLDHAAFSKKIETSNSVEDFGGLKRQMSTPHAL